MADAKDMDAAWFPRSDLLAAISKETAQHRRAIYTLGTKLATDEKTYTVMMDPKNDPAGHNGRTVSIPPGAMFTAAPKRYMEAAPIPNHELATRLYKTCWKLGLKDAEIIGTTEGAWMSNKTMDDLATITKGYNTQDNPNGGAKFFAHLFEREIRTQRDRNGRG